MSVQKSGKLKIALFSLANILEVQGATEPYYVLKHLGKRHDVCAYLPYRSSGREGNVRLVPKIPGFAVFVSYNLCVIPLLFQRKARSCDLVYTYKGVMTPAMVLKFLFGKKWVCDFRTSPVSQEIEFKTANKRLGLFRRFSYFLARLLYKTTLPHCDLVVAVSEAVRREIIDEYGVPEDRAVVLPLGADLDLFKPGQGSLLEAGKTGFRVVYCGAVAPQRGLDTAIRAISLLEKRVPARLLVIGRGSEDAVGKLKKLSKELGVGGLVEWAGFIPHEQVPRFLSSCHVAISPLPPLRAYEVSSPAKVVEYLAAGLPVIATDIMAHRRVIEHGKNGLLVPPQDPCALAAAIERIYNDSGLRLALGEKGRQSVERFSWRALTADLEKELVRLL